MLPDLLLPVGPAQMLILHQYHLSPYNEKVRRMLNAKGIPYQEKYWLLFTSPRKQHVAAISAK